MQPKVFYSNKWKAPGIFTWPLETHVAFYVTGAVEFPDPRPSQRPGIQSIKLMIHIRICYYRFLSFFDMICVDI